MRLMLPAWLGSDTALDEAVQNGDLPRMREMYEEWPFFTSYVDMLEMVLSKTDSEISEVYEARLVPEELKALGSNLRSRLHRAVDMVLQLKQIDDIAGA